VSGKLAGVLGCTVGRAVALVVGRAVALALGATVALALGAVDAAVDTVNARSLALLVGSSAWLFSSVSTNAVLTFWPAAGTHVTRAAIITVTVSFTACPVYNTDTPSRVTPPLVTGVIVGCSEGMRDTLIDCGSVSKHAGSRSNTPTSPVTGAVPTFRTVSVKLIVSPTRTCVRSAVTAKTSS
jgi:hypothetical protein